MKVGVIAAGTTKFGELWNESPRQLVKNVVADSLKQTNLTLAQIDAVYVGNMLSGILGNQENLGAFFTEELGITAPAFKIEGACASGGLAVHNATLSILAGKYHRVLVIGVEKMTDHKPEEIAYALMGAGSEGERIAGLTFPGLYALMARVYMKRYGITEKDLSLVGVKNHYHASFNPKAHFRSRITSSDVLNSPKIADPLKLLDCSPVSDGAAALILTDENTALKKSSHPVWIRASCVATDTLALSQRQDLTSLNAAYLAAQNAYKEAQLGPETLDIVELHDCFSIAEFMAIEDLSLAGRGQAANKLSVNAFTLGQSKKTVINTSGGLKACGHPVGATGVKQIAEIVDQLRGASNGRQIKNANVGLAHNVGGSGAVAAIHILTNQ